MKLDKAIEIQTSVVKMPEPFTDPDMRDATKLGIEAMKREQANRDNPDFIMVGKLPGETED